ncbi:hypothetical protein SI65_05025 [Aspergillus cristatus]|uniref:Uncharacterized protein n=1 Tax=Aspergillus cristatus TaxID=573508 RepID=A0A1E3BGH9_ASPCR|nr:hypothetical protein SI65_05025 [Aspergillus cristatus]
MSILQQGLETLHPRTRDWVQSLSRLSVSATMRIPIKWDTPPVLNPNFPDVSLDLAGVVSLADISTSNQRTVLTGTSALLDCLVLCPGAHLQQHAGELNKGEYPATANMKSGYVFRVENPAAVYYLQKIGKTGHLTTVDVVNTESRQRLNKHWERSFSLDNANAISTVAYLTAVSLTITVLVVLALMHDWWGLFVTIILIIYRLLNVIITRRRSETKWGGAKEGNIPADLLILLSQDRWIRMKGNVDDIKAVTSGQWLRGMTFLESWVAAFATVLVYLNAALASNAKLFGKVILILLLIVSAGLLAIANEWTEKLQMHGNIVRRGQGKPKLYNRRRDMADELIEEMGGRTEWAIKMGLVNSDYTPPSQETSRDGSQAELQRGKTGTNTEINQVVM